MSSVKWEAPFGVWVKAVFQWFYVGCIGFWLWLLTYFPMGPLAILTAKYGTNAYGEKEAKHDQKYIDLGSSGLWKYLFTSVPVLRCFNVYEDGFLGEPSGKTSARVGGKENTFWNKYNWVTRNSFNQLKRTTRFFACYVNDCVIQYWGDKVVSDKNLSQAGSYLVMAVDKNTRKVYFGYRKVLHFDTLVWYIKLKEVFSKVSFLKKYAPMLENKLFQATFGYKIKPTHAEEVQDSDDLDKAFTFRVQFWANPN